MSDTNSAAVRPARRSGLAIATAWLLGAGIPLLAIVFGVCLVKRNWEAAGPEYLMRYVFGERKTDPDLASKIRDAITRDWSLIAGYFLILLVCALIFYVIISQFSETGKKLSYAILGAVAVLTGMDILENLLILWSLNPPHFPDWLQPPPRFWVVAPAAVATVKWCTAIVAVCAIPAAVFASARVIVSYVSRLIRQRGRTRWWDRVLVPRPEPSPPATTDPQVDIESNWRRAYFVPGADGLLSEKNADGQDVARTATALCLSGGGIRSGCVAMGAMQTLSREPAGEEPARWGTAPLLDEFDYIISVSGGGYTSGARLLAVQEDKVGGPVAALADRFSPGSPEFAFLRRRASYIADTPMGLVKALGEVLKNLLASAAMVLLVAVIAGWAFGYLVAKLPLAALVPWRRGTSPVGVHIQALDHHVMVAMVAVAIPIAFALLFGLAGLICEYVSVSRGFTQAKTVMNQAAAAATYLAILVAVVTVALPGLMWLCAPLSPTQTTKWPSVAAFGGLAAVAVLQYGATIISMVTKKKEGSAGEVSRVRKLLPPGVVQLAIVLLTLAVLAIAWLLVLGIAAAQVFDSVIRDPTTVTPVPHWKIILLCLVLIVVILSIIDVTSLSLHPFYRGRLARAMAVRRIGGEAKGYPPEEGTWLDRYGHASEGGPKFVFAAAAALSGDAKPAPGLNAVSYVLSADYIGGPALGWLDTKEIIAVAPPRIKRDLTVQAAMAISGAAFASAMGRMNKGFQSLLAVSGARLGTWLPNPTFVKYAKDHAAEPLYPKALPSMRGAGYFYRELFGINKLHARLVQVTDGGHYENLGLVEALRRRCRLIYVIDGGGDTPPLLSGLSDAIRLARFELGVEIELDERGDYGAPKLAPGSSERFGEGNAFYSLKSRLTEGSVVRGLIRYPAAAGLGADSTGMLVVAKAVLWDDLPDWVLTYGAGGSGASFPNDKTSDQWFNEAQFAAYTELGRRIAVKARTVPSYGEYPVPPAGTAVD